MTADKTDEPAKAATVYVVVIKVSTIHIRESFTALTTGDK